MAAFLTAVWIVLKIHRARVASRRAASAVHSIQLRNLTKIYGAPGRFGREWARYERRKGRLGTTEPDSQDLKRIRDALLWKLPLLALLLYFATYFEDEIWIYLHGLALVFMLGHVGRCIGDLWREHLLPAVERIGDILYRVALPVGFVAYVHFRLNLLSVTIATLGLWAAYRLVRWLSGRVGAGVVTPR